MTNIDDFDGFIIVVDVHVDIDDVTSIYNIPFMPWQYFCGVRLSQILAGFFSYKKICDVITGSISPSNDRAHRDASI